MVSISGPDDGEPAKTSDEAADAAFAREAEASWQAFQVNGLHLTGDEVFAWLRTWGTPGESEMPNCHR